MTQPSLLSLLDRDPTERKHGGSDTSQAAHERIRPVKGRDHDAILNRMNCTKRSFDRMSTAQRCLTRMKRKGYLGRIYRCTECGLLHIGRKRKETRRGVGMIIERVS